MKNIEWLKEEIGTEMIQLEPNRKERWSDVKYQTLRNVAHKINQLDEPEVLSQEWIDEHATGDWMYVDDLRKLLVPKQELPVIPVYVAKWIEKVKEYDADILTAIIDGHYNIEVSEWLFINVEQVNVVNIEKLMRAWLDGYTVEEKKYKVFIGEAYEGRGLFLSKSPYDGTVTIGTNLDYFRNRENNKETHLTEKEIKDYDERYWAFAVPVEELEE